MSNRAEKRAWRWRQYRLANDTTFKVITHEGRVTHSHGKQNADRLQRKHVARLRRLRFRNPDAFQPKRMTPHGDR
jgi:hypothetical protein